MNSIRKLSALVLTFAILLCMLPTAASASAFWDVPEGVWYSNAVNWAVEKGITTGTGGGGFSPEAVCTRAQVVTFLWRSEGCPEPNNAYDPFWDVNTGDYFYKAVLWAVEKGITNGLSADCFGAAEACTRAQVATFLWRTKGKPAHGAEYTPFMDISYGAWYYDAVLWAVGAGVTNGLATYSFGPDITCTRGQIVTFLFRANGVHPDSGTGDLSPEQIYAKCSPAVFYMEVYDRSGNAFASGSGFFIDSNGTAVTNYHVIEGAHSAKILTADTNQVYDVQGVYDYSVTEDWAVIQVDGSGFDYLKIGDSNTAVGGATIYAIGSPEGLDNTISEGLISNPSRVLDGVPYIQISAPISHGSSGGALINKNGDVIGITSAGFADGQNLNLALPISVIDGYSRDQLTALSDLFGSDAYDTLCNWLTANYTSTDTDGYHYREDVEYNDGSYSIYTLDWDPQTDLLYSSAGYSEDGYYHFSMLFYEKNAAYMDTGYSYFEDGWGECSGWASIECAAFDEAYSISFSEFEGDTSGIETDKELHLYNLMECLSFTNYIFEHTNSGYTVADLGFLSFT